MADEAREITRFEDDHCKRNGIALPRPSYGDRKKLNAKRLCDWQDATIYYEHPQWMRYASTWRLADLMYQNQPWVTKSYTMDNAATPWWTRMTFKDNDPDAFPMPNFDEFSRPMDNEAARLGKPKYEPTPRITKADADLKQKEAADVARDVLQGEVQRTNFEYEQFKFHHGLPMYGGSYFVMWWDESWEETVRLPMLSASRCPSCGFRVADTEIKGDRLEGIDQARYETEEIDLDGEMDAVPVHNLTHCLTCETHKEQVFQPGIMEGDPGGMVDTDMPGPPKLEPFTPIGEELTETDHFGDDLGQDVPLGRWAVRCGNAHDYFPENVGIDQSPDRVNQETWVHVESVEWVRNRFPNGYLVKPEKEDALARWHPIAGEGTLFFSGVDGGLNTFQSAVRVKHTMVRPYREYVKDKAGNVQIGSDGRPKCRMNKGRYIVSAAGVVLFDGDLIITHPTNPKEFVERMKIVYVPHKLRSGGREMFGYSDAEGLFDAASNICEIHSQTMDERQTGSSKWLAERSQGLFYNANDKAGGVWTWLDNGSGTPPPRQIESKVINAQVYTELEFDLTYIDRRSNNEKVDQGNFPPGAAAVTLQLLSEQTSELRRDRIQRIRRALEVVYTHCLKCNHILASEERIAEFSDADDTWKRRAWKGADLAGVTDIQVNAEPEHETELLRQQSLRDGIEAQLFDLAEPNVRRILAKELKIKTELFEQYKIQEDEAEREYLDFKDGVGEPVVDEDLDDHAAHDDRHGKDCMSDYWRDLEKRAGWNRAVKVIDGWREPITVPLPQPQVGPDGTVQTTTQVLQLDMIKQIVASKSPLPPFMFLTEPPRCLQDMILAVWDLRLQGAQYQVQPAEFDSLRQVLVFRAHRSAHRLTSEKQKQAAQAGVQQLAAPGGETTAAGTIPSGNGVPMAQGAPAAQPAAVM